jgi:hypothetical protein
LFTIGLQRSDLVEDGVLGDVDLSAALLPEVDGSVEVGLVALQETVLTAGGRGGDLFDVWGTVLQGDDVVQTHRRGVSDLARVWVDGARVQVPQDILRTDLLPLHVKYLWMAEHSLVSSRQAALTSQVKNVSNI